jgi:hypothetical protein
VYVGSVVRFVMRTLSVSIVVPVYAVPHPTLKLVSLELEQVVVVLELQMSSALDGHGGAT